MEPDSKMTNDPNIHTLELQDDIGDATLNEAKATIEKLLKGTMAVEDAINQDTFTMINKSMETCKQRLGENKTPALWIQYMKLVDILRRSIKAERTGDFLLHLDSVRQMIPFLAASGHNNYTKSAWIYYQQMTELQNSHPHVYRQFMNGHHVVRRTEQPFVGISTDLAIEQILMRSIKSSGGLTRGTGLGEDERLIWLMCIPACAEVHQAMQEVTGVSYDSSEQHVQHVDSSPTRQKRDSKRYQDNSQVPGGQKPFHKC